MRHAPPLDRDNADWLPRNQATLPDGVRDGPTLLAWLASQGQSLGGFRTTPMYASLVRQHEWMAQVEAT